jgi:hypothetical protein
MVSSISVKAFVTSLLSTNLTHSHINVINIHRIEIIHWSKRPFARSSLAVYMCFYKTHKSRFLRVDAQQCLAEMTLFRSFLKTFFPVIRAMPAFEWAVVHPRRHCRLLTVAIYKYYWLCMYKISDQLKTSCLFKWRQIPEGLATSSVRPRSRSTALYTHLQIE